MRIAAKCLAAATFAVAAIGIGAAQDQPRQRPGGGGGFGGGGFGGGPGLLVSNEAVLEDIKATDDQKAKLKDWAKASGEKAREAFKGFRDLSPEQQKAKMAETQATTWKEIGTVLQPEQVTRIKQISHQQAGIRAFSQPDVQEALKLTDDQKAKIKEVGEEYQKDVQDLRQGNSRPDASKLAGLRKEALENAAKVLTDDQKKTWKDLTGEPFDTSKLGFGGPGGPGGGRGGQRPGGQRPGGNNN